MVSAEEVVLYGRPFLYCKLFFPPMVRDFPFLNPTWFLLLGFFTIMDRSVTVSHDSIFLIELIETLLGRALTLVLSLFIFCELL